MQGFGLAPVSLVPKPQPSGTGGMTAGLLLTWSLPSTAQSRTQFSLVCNKWRKEGYSVVDTISFVGQGESASLLVAATPGSKLQPIRTSGTATGLFSAWCPLSASQARTQFNLVHKKWHSVGYSVIGTVFFVVDFQVKPALSERKTKPSPRRPDYPRPWNTRPPMKDAKKGAAGATTRVNSQSPGTGPPSKIGETRIQAKTKAESTKEIQRLGALCESRTKELTMLKLQLRHASAGFASFAVHVQHLNAQVLQNNSFRIPKMSEESQKSQEEIEKPRIAIEKGTDKKIDAINEEYTLQLDSINEDHKARQKELQQRYEALQQQYKQLQQQAREFQESVLSDTDAKIQWLSKKNADLQKEVQSLNVVLEMRANQIQNLQHAKIELERKEEELDRCKVKMQKMEARIEDLQELLNEQFCGTKEEQ
ncbi:hypothetical protein MRX96_034655 [Rhipicephalus microplus]